MHDDGKGRNVDPGFENDKITHIFDRTVVAAKNRGAKVPAIEDLLMIAIQDGGVRQAFRERGINVDGLYGDLEYTTHYGRPSGIPDSDDGEFSARITRQINYLERKLDEYARSIEGTESEAFTDGVSAAVQTIRIWATESDDTVDDEDLKVREQVFNHAANRLASFIVNQEVDESGEREDAVQDMLRTVHGLQNYLAYLRGSPKDNSWSWYKHQIEFRYGLDISPYQFGMFLIEAADPYVGYLLRRNGMVTDGNYTPPVTLPPNHITSLASAVYTYVHKQGAATLEPIHFLPFVLNDPQVRSRLSNAGIGNWEKLRSEAFPDMRIGGYRSFRDDVEVLVFKRAKKGEEIYRQPTVASEAARSLLATLAQRIKGVDEDKIGLILFDLLTEQGRNEHKEAAEYPYLTDIWGNLQPEMLSGNAYRILHACGLSAAVLDGWPEAIKEDVKPLPAEEREAAQRKKEDRKIGDRDYVEVLKEHTDDLTAAAAEGRYDDILVRADEISNVFSTLSRVKKRNLLIVGDSGTGKTALAHGIAKRIADGVGVPERFIGSKVIEVHFESANATEDAMFRGQFEVKLKNIIEGTAERNRELQAKGAAGETILFIDEFDTAIKQGTAAGTDGAGKLIKKKVVDGSLSVIAAATLESYYRDIYPDPELSRRFQPYFLKKPDRGLCLQILAMVAQSFEKKQNVIIPADLLEVAYDLSERYLHDKRNPDASISLIDSATGRAKVQRKAQISRDDLIDEIASLTGLSADFLNGNERLRYSTIDKILASKIIGQKSATDRIALALQRASLGLSKKGKTQGAFLLPGPTGTGKTQTIKEVAVIKNGTVDSVINLNMSRYKYAGGGVKFLEDLAEQVSKRRDAVLLLDEIDQAHPDVFKALYSVIDEGKVQNHAGLTVSLEQTIIGLTTNVGVEEAQAYIKRLGIENKPDDPRWAEVDAIYKAAAIERFGAPLIGRIGHDNICPYRPLTLQAAYQIVAQEITQLSESLESEIGQKLHVSEEVHERLAHIGLEVMRTSGLGGRAAQDLIRERVADPLTKVLMTVKGDHVLANEFERKGPGTIHITDIGEKVIEDKPTKGGRIKDKENVRTIYTINYKRRPRRPKDRPGAPPVAETATAEAA